MKPTDRERGRAHALEEAVWQSRANGEPRAHQLDICIRAVQAYQTTSALALAKAHAAGRAERDADFSHLIDKVAHGAHAGGRMLMATDFRELAEAAEVGLLQSHERAVAAGYAESGIPVSGMAEAFRRFVDAVNLLAKLPTPEAE